MYIVATDLIAVMTDIDSISLTDDGDIGELDVAIINNNILIAGSIVDAFIGKRYRLPLAVVPQIVKSAVMDIVVYKLCSRGVFAPSDTRIKAYDDAISLLKDIAKGVAVLDLDTGTEVVSSFSSSNATSDNRVFTKETMGGV